MNIEELNLAFCILAAFALFFLMLIWFWNRQLEKEHEDLKYEFRELRHFVNVEIKPEVEKLKKRREKIEEKLAEKRRQQIKQTLQEFWNNILKKTKKTT